MLDHYGHSQEAKPRRWFVLEVPDDGRAVLHDFVTFAETRSKLIELDGSAVSVFVFYGVQALLSKNKPRRLIHPNGTVYMLQPADEEFVVAGDGYLGDREFADDDDDNATELAFEADEDDDE